jgi:glycerol-3-phosphate O-acyltransferase/dihydroxyacetone phosphate acyltransferase
VFVKIGEPIKLSDYKEQYLKDAKEGVVQLTERVKVDMEKQIVVIEDDKHEKLIKQIEILYRSKLRQESKEEDKATQDFRLSQDIVEAVSYFEEMDPGVVNDFEHKITIYLKQLKRLKLRDSQIKSSSISLNFIWRILYFVLGFPLYVYGVVTNFIPYKLAERIAKLNMIREDFVGSIKLAAGMLIFLLVYIIEASIVGLFTNYIWGLLFFVSLYPAGLFTTDYIKTYYQTKGAVKYLRLFLRKSDLIASLKTTRQELIDELEKRKIEFLAQR